MAFTRRILNAAAAVLLKSCRIFSSIKDLCHRNCRRQCRCRHRHCCRCQVFRVQANFFSDAKADAMKDGGLGARCPWFAKEAMIKPRDNLVASPGYAFVSADYSQVMKCVRTRVRY